MVRIARLVAQLTEGIPADESERTPEERGRWLLANVLDWHRRVEKAVWWEYFRLEALLSGGFAGRAHRAFGPYLRLC
jgi:uncharacterized protein